MDKEFIPYEEALALKELGFDESCLAEIDQTEYVHIKGTKNHPRGSMVYNIIDCPLYQQAFRWFREKHGLECSISRMPPQIVAKSQVNQGNIKKYLGFIWCEFNNPRGEASIYTDTYEEAELACLRKLIEICQTRNLKD